MLEREFEGMAARCDQVMPSEEPSTRPSPPTATNREPSQRTSDRKACVPELRSAQAAPSVLERIAPFSPTATQVPPPYARPSRRLPTCVSTRLQLCASVLTRMRSEEHR